MAFFCVVSAGTTTQQGKRQCREVSAQHRAEIGRVEIVEVMEIGRVAIVEDIVIYVDLYSASPTGYKREAFPLPRRAG